MIVHPHKPKDPQFEDYIIGTYITPMMKTKPETDTHVPTHTCDKCSSPFDYEHTLKVHLSTVHLGPDTEFEFFSNFDYFGGLKKTREITPIVGPIEETIVNHSKLKVVFMNVNSLVSPVKRYKARLGIEKSKSDIIIMAETKLGKKNTEFKVRGYYTAANLTRKLTAGGLVVMAKDQIKLHSVSMKNVLPEIQVVTFKFEEFTFISVYRSPNLGKTKARDHHKLLISHLDREINKLKGSQYTQSGLIRNDAKTH